MPLFKIEKQSLVKITQKNFRIEKELQHLVEDNLEEVFNSMFIATEFSTGTVHAGRIDTLALSEDKNPVIIEYKKTESSELINQSLYYLAWINDHRGDFEIAVQKKLGKSIKIDWSDIRVICIAPNYRKYDLYAVKMMGANIELWTYRYFDNNTIYLEETFRKTLLETVAPAEEKNPVMVEAGRKAALTRATATYSFDEHIQGKDERIQKIVQGIREYIMGLDSSIEEVPKKFYIAYKISQNIVCMEAQKQKVYLYLKLNPKAISKPPSGFRDVTKIGHYGTGDTELSISTEEDFEKAKPIIQMAYENVGG